MMNDGDVLKANRADGQIIRQEAEEKANETTHYCSELSAAATLSLFSPLTRGRLPDLLLFSSTQL